MTRLPPRLRPLWPVVKRLHRWASLWSGRVGRATRALQGDRRLPRSAALTSAATAAQEPGTVTFHPAGLGEQLDRTPPSGTPAGHWIFPRRADVKVRDPYCLEVAGGIVVGDYAATITPGGILDHETSQYFGVRDWREHPLFLRRRLPEPTEFDGTLLVLGTRGAANYYHYLTDVLPRHGVFTDAMPDTRPDAIYVPTGAAWQRKLLDLAGLGDLPVVEMTKHSTVRASRLLVPSLTNDLEVAPAATVRWVRDRFRPSGSEPTPRRIYVTRGTTPNTRRVTCEDELVPALEERGFVVVEPGGLSPQEQVDVFAGAEVVVAPHGAALTNLLFAPEGVRVLEMFTAGYVVECYWAICQNIPGAQYRYLVAGDVDRHGPGDPMNKVQADVEVDAATVLAAVDELLAAPD
ncbi:DUF563 domain-containing protein [Aeromicrobium sp. Leaf350]|uniref:glycosyltransferase family 61 protein n=1 Tax=Aeromicrobium sp. Leaf350 TaxID=2876565 RepID=UPI001E64E6DA|nr:glycosyltransferase family 61 protein [Aeromicrobium sp. Leaf350]